ncbi:hypothetical protein [Agrococcus sp. ProA11]|uniref:hypothetical protein n=1 Tax=Agrococcus chionoecetis TaxID=3153752 RepID=UPI0032612F35
MSDVNGERPLTRRELRARERAAELAANGDSTPEPDAEQRAGDDEPAQLGRHSTPSVPAAPESGDVLEAELVSEESGTEEPVATPAPPKDPQPSKPIGRFFGRKKKSEAGDAPAPDAAQEPAETVAMEQVDVQKVDADSADAADAIQAEIAEPHGSAPTGGSAVPAPSSARRSSAHIDDVQGLDTVDDAEVDDVEIDEVIVAQPRVSSRRVAEVTPAQLEDRRLAQEEADDAVVSGPSRGRSQRLPVIVNVVSDTSEHHIADLREQGVAGKGSGSGSSITANALVLPAGSESPDFTLEGDDGLLVTGSIDVPEGFASSGRGSVSIDGNDVDSDVAEGEVSSPETAPVRASKAVSSYANARVQIAPKKQRSNVWPVAIGVGAGGVAVAVAGFLALALSQGWL